MFQLHLYIQPLVIQRSEKKKQTTNQSELFSYYYSVVMELLVPQSEAASKLMRKFSDKSDNW